MLANQQSYEHGLDDLKLSFETLIDEHKHKANKKTVGSIFKEVDCRNTESLIQMFRALTLQNSLCHLLRIHMKSI